MKAENNLKVLKCSECSKEEDSERAVEEELNEFFKKAKKIIEKITPKPEFTEQFPKPTWQEDAKKFIMEAVEKGQKITEIDDMPAYGWYEEYPTYFTNSEKITRTVAYEYNGITVPVWVFIDNRPENGINEFKLWEWIKTLPEDHELRRKAEAEENAVRQYYKKKDELLRKWEEENGVYLKMLFELYQSMSYDAQIEFSDDFLSNGKEVYESILAWMDDSECSKEEDAIAMKTVEAEVVQKLKDKYSIDEVEDLYYTDLEKYVEFYKEFMNAVKEEVQKLVNDGFVPVTVKNVEERQKYVVDENIAYQLRGEYAFVKFNDAEFTYITCGG